MPAAWPALHSCCLLPHTAVARCRAQQCCVRPCPPPRYPPRRLLQHNNFSGPLPPFLLPALPALRNLDLSDNALTGTLEAGRPSPESPGTQLGADKLPPWRVVAIQLYRL